MDEHKKAAVAIFILVQTDFNLVSILRDNEGNFVLINLFHHQEDKTTINMYISITEVQNT
jgi:hypothetical protein